LLDLAFVARNALWVVGLSLALAAWSWSYWWAGMQHAGRQTGVRAALGRRAFVVPFWLGMLLFAASLAWGATLWWERGLWFVLAGAFLW
jgi:hypothetical protein